MNEILGICLLSSRMIVFNSKILSISLKEFIIGFEFISISLKEQKIAIVLIGQVKGPNLEISIDLIIAIFILYLYIQIN